MCHAALCRPASSPICVCVFIALMSNITQQPAAEHESNNVRVLRGGSSILHYSAGCSLFQPGPPADTERSGEPGLNRNNRTDRMGLIWGLGLILGWTGCGGCPFP